MFRERASAIAGPLSDFVVAPRPWSELPDWVKRDLVRDGEQELGKPYAALDAVAYLAYTRTGDRVAYEEPYFARRRMLNALVLAECVEGAGRFLDRIVEGVWLLCEETGWQLPAHNSYERGAKRLALPDPDRPVIDLFAAETAAQLAVLAQLLGPALERVAPGLVARIDRELERRIFRPYLDQHLWWMGQGDERMNNWTAWCTQNALLAVFTRPTDQAFRQAVVQKAAASLDAFLKDYGEDGACDEGVLYYRHAGLCLFNALHVLDTGAPGAFTALWREPKIRNVAEYIVHMHVDGQRYFNFADSSAVVERCGAREFLFGRAVGSAVLADFAATDWKVERRATLPDEINLFYRVQAAFAAADLDAHQAAAVTKPDTFLPSVGLLVARDDRFALAVKAGDNGDGHNHNDVGSVILYKEGKPILIDIGVETYTAKTFSRQRYDIWTMQSPYHNLPTFEGVGQQDGEQFAARVVEVSFGEGFATIEMDIAGAYPPEAALRSYRRRVHLRKGHDMTIVDRCDGDKGAVLSLMLAVEPMIEASTIVLPGVASLTLTGGAPPTVEAIPISDARLRGAWPYRLYRVLVPLTGNELTITIT
jgi:hypothetical protein